MRLYGNILSEVFTEECWTTKRIEKKKNRKKDQSTMLYISFEYNNNKEAFKAAFIHCVYVQGLAFHAISCEIYMPNKNK